MSCRFGHRYEPRFDEVPRDVSSLRANGCTAEEFRELTIVRVYVADVCVRCGDVVDARRVARPEKIVEAK